MESVEVCFLEVSGGMGNVGGCRYDGWLAFFCVGDRQ